MEAEDRYRTARACGQKTVRREGIEPIKFFFAYVLLSVTHNKMVQDCRFLYMTFFRKKNLCVNLYMANIVFKK